MPVQTVAAQTIWDLPTRLIHWSLAIAITFNLFILEEGDEAHQWVGYVAVGLVSLRMIWGFIGSPFSRFSSFPIHPRELIRFQKGLFRKDPLVYLGHNPAASIVYFLIWGSVLSLGLSGWLMETDTFWGEEWLQNLHANISIALQGLILIHFLGMTLDALRYKRKTWLAMINGKRV